MNMRSFSCKSVEGVTVMTPDVLLLLNGQY